MARRIDYQKLLMEGIPDENGWMVKKIDVMELQTDYNYQRFPKESKINAIVDHFEARFVGAFTVGRRADGTYYVLDGNHRKEAIRRLLEMREPISRYVRCEILENTTPRIEAGIFVGKNTNNPVNGVALYKACRMMRQEPYVTIDKILTKYNFEVELLEAGKPSPRNGRGLRGAPTILRAYRSGEAHFESAVKVLHDVWRKDTDAHSGEFLFGVVNYLHTQLCSYNTTKLQSVVNRLKNMPARIGIELASTEKHSTARIKRLAIWLADLTGVPRPLNIRIAA